MRREIRLLDAEASYSVLSDRAVIPPYGVLGGGPAQPYRVLLQRGEQALEFPTPGKVTGFPLREQDLVRMHSGGGGGYGDPLRRDPERVRADVDYGVVSPERARAGYGVVLTPAGEVDAAATAALRAELDAARVRVRVIADDALQPYVGRRGKRRTVTLDAETARRLGAVHDDLLELLGRHPAPLRAWTRISAEAEPGAVHLDAFGRTVLGVADGDPVLLRPVPTVPVPGGLAY
jgi:N-methylhydantoinase B